MGLNIWDTKASNTHEDRRQLSFGVNPLTDHGFDEAKALSSRWLGSGDSVEERGGSHLMQSAPHPGFIYQPGAKFGTSLDVIRESIGGRKAAAS